MKILNLYGAPGSGKSTVASHIFTYLKRHHVKTELVGEFAKELIYEGRSDQLFNQVYIMGMQYKKLKDYERYGSANLVIADSPLLMQSVYCREKSYANEIIPLLKKLDTEFDNINVFVRRASPYQEFGRVHSESESDELSKTIWELIKDNTHYTIDGNLDGADFIAREALRHADADLEASLHLPKVIDPLA